MDNNGGSEARVREDEELEWFRYRISQYFDEKDVNIDWQMIDHRLPFDYHSIEKLPHMVRQKEYVTRPETVAELRLRDLLDNAQERSKRLEPKDRLIAYAQALGLVISVPGAHSQLLARRIAGDIIILLAKRHPKLQKDPFKGPIQLCATAFLKYLPLEMDGNPSPDLLVALGYIAEWLNWGSGDMESARLIPKNRKIADNLFGIIDNFMQTTMKGELEHFRLIFRWASVCCYGTSGDSPSAYQQHQRRAEQMYASALKGFTSLLGHLHAETIEHKLVVGSWHLYDGRLSTAERLYGSLYKTQLDASRSANTDDLMLQTLLGLAECYWLQDKREEACALLWSLPEPNYVSGLVEVTGVELEKAPKGLKEHIWQSIRMAAVVHPDNAGIMWESRALCCLPIRRLTFKPVCPSNEVIQRFWRVRNYPRHQDNPSAHLDNVLHYSFEVAGDSCIDLTVPYIPYEHFRQSKEYSSGFAYIFRSGFSLTLTRARNGEWNDNLSGNGIFDYENSKRVGDRPVVESDPSAVDQDLPVWSPSLQSSIVKGFFNSIPGDSAIVQDSLEFHLVSSQWIDYHRFTLHQVMEAFAPSLKAADGSPIKCHGYISGTWTDFNVEFQQHGVMLFVVDALFSIPGSFEKHNFLFHRGLLEELHSWRMGWDAKRRFALTVNPTLVSTGLISLNAFSRLVIDGPISRGRRPRIRHMHMSAFPNNREEKRKRISITPPSFESLLWEEMCRRELWDRDYEAQSSYNPKAREELEREKMEEDQARAAWDAEYWAQRKVTQALKQSIVQGHPPNEPSPADSPSQTKIPRNAMRSFSFTHLLKRYALRKERRED